MKLFDIINDEITQVTNFNLGELEFNGIYATDLLSAAIKSAPSGGVLITIINNLNTIATAVMCDLSAVILCECDAVDDDVLNRANENEVVIFKTSLKLHEVIILLNNKKIV